MKQHLLTGLLAMVLLGSLPLAAQNAALTGTIKDVQGSVIPNVKITLANLDTGVEQSSNADGSERVAL